MRESRQDPEARLRDAEQILDRAAEQLLVLLKQASRQLRPFPPYPGAFFTFGVEVEPDTAHAPDVGCVVVTEEGDLKELRIGLDAETAAGLGSLDPVSLRDEQLVDLHLNSRDRLFYAYGGLRAITRLLRERAAGSQEAPNGA